MRRIHAEMKQKGVPSDVAESVLHELKATEIERAKALWLKKFGQPPTTQKETDQQMRFMVTRGFSSTLLKGIYASYKEQAEREQEKK